MKEFKTADEMFDYYQKIGLDELQKFFDGGGKLDFTDFGSIDEICNIFDDEFKNKPKFIFDENGIRQEQTK